MKLFELEALILDNGSWSYSGRARYLADFFYISVNAMMRW